MTRQFSFDQVKDRERELRGERLGQVGLARPGVAEDQDAVTILDNARSPADSGACASVSSEIPMPASSCTARACTTHGGASRTYEELTTVCVCDLHV